MKSITKICMYNLCITGMNQPLTGEINHKNAKTHIIKSFIDFYLEYKSVFYLFFHNVTSCDTPIFFMIPKNGFWTR